MLLRVFSNDDSALVKQLQELKNKSVAEFKQVLADRRETGMFLDVSGTPNNFTCNGYIVYTTDERAVSLYTSPAVSDSTGNFDQTQLDKCIIERIKVIPFPRNDEN